MNSSFARATDVCMQNCKCVVHLVRCMQNLNSKRAERDALLACTREEEREEKGRAACNKHNMIIVFSDPAGRSSRIVDRIKRYELYARRPRRLPRWRRLRGQPAILVPARARRVKQYDLLHMHHFASSSSPKSSFRAPKWSLSF